MTTRIRFYGSWTGEKYRAGAARSHRAGGAGGRDHGPGCLCGPTEPGPGPPPSVSRVRLEFATSKGLLRSVAENPLPAIAFLISRARLPTPPSPRTDHRIARASLHPCMFFPQFLTSCCDFWLPRGNARTAALLRGPGNAWRERKGEREREDLCARTYIN